MIKLNTKLSPANSIKQAAKQGGPHFHTDVVVVSPNTIELLIEELGARVMYSDITTGTVTLPAVLIDCLGDKLPVVKDFKMADEEVCLFGHKEDTTTGALEVLANDPALSMPTKEFDDELEKMLNA